MSTMHVRTFGTLGFGLPWDGGLWSVIRPSEPMLLSLHKFIDNISPFNLRRGPGDGPGHEPEQGESRASPWDDPALWLLMIH